jgi:hypothetical protein
MNSKYKALFKSPLRMVVTSSLVLLALCLACLPALAQLANVQSKATAPTPWSGPRDKSCDLYHSNKYKKPLYDANAINEHLISVLGVDNTPKLFYRWERPVRYYLEVPPEYPQLAKQFEAQVAQVARYTGLDMARHDKPYLEYKDPKRNDKSQWPDGLSTNVMFIITTDVTKTVQDPLVSEMLKGFGVTPEKEISNLERSTSKKTVSRRYGFDPQSLKFVLQINALNGDYSEKPLASKKTSVIPAEIMSWASVLYVGNKKFPSYLADDEINYFSDFDKQFLRVLYGPHVHSGMLLIKAKRLMMEELVDCFNAKGA